MTATGTASALRWVVVLAALTASACGERTALGPCGNCPIGFTCFDDACYKPCEADGDCGPTGQCDGSHCVRECDVDSDCAPLNDGGCAGAPSCNEGLCEYPGACAAGEACYEGSCLPACDDDGDCAPGATCEDGACVPQTCSAAAQSPTDADCVSDIVCLVSPGTCVDGGCTYDWAAGGATCDDGDPCTSGSTCDAEHSCGGGTVDVGAPCATDGGGSGICIDSIAPDGLTACSDADCFIDGVLWSGGAVDPINPCASCNPASDNGDWTYAPEQSPCDGDGDGTDDGYCLEPNPGAGERDCRDDVCIIGGTVVAAGAAAPGNDCASCDPTSDQGDWTYVAPQSSCDTDGDGTDDGLCLPPDAGTEPLTCRDDRCIIGGFTYASGDPHPSDSCQICDPSRGGEYLTDWYDLVGRSCPLGCSLDPIPHCVQPSNWGYWSGTTAVSDGVSLPWLESAGGQPLQASSGTVVIDTGSAGAPSLIVAGTPVSLAADLDYRLVPQSAFHQGAAAPPGVAPPAIPDLVAIKLSTIDLDGSVSVQCTGSRPLALVSAGDVHIGGTWSVRCGAQSFGAGESSGVAVNQYGVRGGGGGGYAGRGGHSGSGVIFRAGGDAYGRPELQPLLGGSPGGAGFSNKALNTSALGGNGGDGPCWYNAARACSNETFDAWRTGTWDGMVPTVAPQGGAAGGGLQISSLGVLTVDAILDAAGTPGTSGHQCGDASANYAGNRLLDWLSYPIKANCGGCGDPSYANRSWSHWYLQTGGGGASGGALLLEAASVLVDPAARLLVEGGGGGGGCYTNAFTGTPSGTTFAEFGGAYLLAVVPTVDASGTTGAQVSIFDNMWGGAGAALVDGANAPYGSANPSDYTSTFTRANGDVTVVEVKVPTAELVAWGGGGGGTGRIRINTPDGTITCGGNCSNVFAPSTAASCDGTSPAEICTFPSGAHFSN